MIISDPLIRYLKLVGTREPIYWLDDPVVRRYEILREYATADFTARKLNELAVRYEITTKSIKNYLDIKRKDGTLALFIEPLLADFSVLTPELEKKIITLYQGGVKTGKEMLNTLRVLDPALKKRGLTTRHIYQTLKSHGLMPIEGLELINFQTLQALLATFVKHTQKRNGRPIEAFDNPKDLVQQRLEMFRAVYYAPPDQGKMTIVTAAEAYGLSKAQFFNIKKVFQAFGVLGLLPMNRGRVSKHKLTPEIEIKIVQHKLNEPTLSAKALHQWSAEQLGLSTAQITIDKVVNFWFGAMGQTRFHKEQTDIGRQVPHVSTAEAVMIPTAKKQSVRQLYGLSFPVPQVEMLFADIMHWLGQGHGIEISRPGLFIMAPYLRKLGIYECFETFVRENFLSRNVFYSILVNINRILGGLCTINRLQFESELSIALASGLGALLSPPTIHKGLEELTPELIHQLKLDVARAARHLGLIEGRKSAFDFHFIIFYGDDADVKGFTKGPTKKNVCLPGHRPHIWWDLGANTIGFIYYCQGQERAAKTVLPFLHTCVFEVIDPEMLAEVFMDSEYTSFEIFSYLADTEELNVDVTMCMRSNVLRKFITDKLENGPWRAWSKNAKYEICSARVSLEELGRTVHLVLKRKVGKTSFRIFATTRENLTDEELLNEYGDRWGIETGIKDLVYSYFLDQVPSNGDPVKVDAHFYCVMAAKLAVDLFIKELGGFVAHDRNQSKRTLHSLRDILFTGKPTRLSREFDQLVLTYHDPIQTAAWDLLMQLQAAQETEVLEMAVPWWGGMRPVVRHQAQLPEPLRGPLKSIQLVSPDFLAEDLVRKTGGLK